jgi:fibronectin type 3 domain-containing protein
MRWGPFKIVLKPSKPPGRQQRLKQQRLRLEELESRVVPSTNVTAYHQAIPDTSTSTIGAGVDANETVLTPANVTPATFGKLYSTPVDGQVYAQPLYMENVNVTSGTAPGLHNVVFVATQNDSLYAIDSTTGRILWQDALLTPEHGGTVTAVPSSAVGSSDIAPEIGITATPVIDPGTNTIFVEAKTQEVAVDGTHFEHHLYAIDIQSGRIVNDVLIADSVGDLAVSGPSVAGSGDGSVNGVLQFDSLRELDRPGLTLVDGSIFLSYASHGDNGPYHGWILGYSEATLAPTAVFNVDPNGDDGGIWQSGGSLAYETVAGNTYLYFESGNGTFDTSLIPSPFVPNLMIPQYGDYGDSFVKVELDGTTVSGSNLNAPNNMNGWGMHVVDYFTPTNEGNLDAGDTDLGSAGVLLLPASAGSAAHPNLLVGAGKEGRIYVIDRNAMGGYSGDLAGDGMSGTDNVVQESVAGLLNGALDTMTYYDGALYTVGSYGSLAQTFPFANGSLTTTASSVSPDSYPYPGSTATISTNPSDGNAIVWDISGPGSNELRAYSAGSGYASEIYTSDQAPNSRDSMGSAAKFAVPTVADGEVFVGTSNSLVAYGLIQTAVAPPQSPSNLTANSFSSSLVNLFWTRNDSAPNTASTYSIFESTDGTNFTFAGTASAGATSYPVGGLQPSTQYYFEITASNSIGASAVSNLATATTASQASGLNFANGFAGSGGQLSYNGSASIYGNTAELTYASAGLAGSVFSASPISVSAFSTQFSFQLTNAQADGFTFTIQGNGPTALGGFGGGLGYQGITNSLAIKFDVYSNQGEGNDSTGLYVNGASPTLPAIDLTSTGIELDSGDLMEVAMSYDGTKLTVALTDETTNKGTSQSYVVNIPQAIGSSTAYVGFTGGTGGLSAVQQILNWSYTPIASTVPAAPSSLTGTVVSGSEIDLSWTNNATNQSGFIIDRSLDGTSYSPLATVSGSTTSYHDTSLSPGETAYYEVQATNAAGSSGFSNVFQAMTAIPPAAPTNLLATSITSTEVDLTWTNVANNATGLKILEQLGNNTPRVIVSGLAPTTTGYDITGLTPGTGYFFEVDALNSSGPSGASTISVDTLPDQVAGLTAVPANGAVTLSWSADAGAKSFDIYRSSSPTQNSTPTFSGIAGTTFVDTTVAPGSTYYYVVTAVDPAAASAGQPPASATGESAPSSAASVTVPAVFPTINLAAGFGGATGLTFNGGAWINGNALQVTDANAGEAHSVFDTTPQQVSAFATQFTFQLSSAQADGFTFTIQGTGATALGAWGGGLGYQGIGNSLAVKFDLYDNQGEGSDSTGLYVNGAAPMSVGSQDMTGTVDLHSGDVMQATLSYDGSNLVETLRDTVSGAVFSHTYTNINVPQLVGSSTAYVGFTGGTGGLTAVQRILSWTYTPTTPAVQVAAPTGLRAASITSTEVDLSWTNVASNAASIRVLEQIGQGSPQVIASGLAPSTTGYSITNLTPGTAYTFEVDAVDSGGAFGSATLAADTLPAAVTGLTAAAGSGSVTLSWSADAGAKSFDIYRSSSPTQNSTPTFSGIAGTTFVDTTVAPGSTYYYVVTAVDPAAASAGQPPASATGESAPSSAASVTVPAVFPTINLAAGFGGATGLTFNGGAWINGNALQVTDANAGEAHSVFDTTPQQVSAFATQFTFQLSSAQADGFTFTIQGTGATALGAWGGGLGYQGIGNSLAVKFDLYDNQGEGSDSTGLYVNGAAPMSVGSQDMTGTVDLHSGDVMQATLSYDGSNLVETLRDTVSGAVFSHTYTNINVPQLVGSSTAYVGFTGGTGGLTAVQRILSWTYTSS